MTEVIRRELFPGVWLRAVHTNKFKSAYLSLTLLAPLSSETAAANALIPAVLRRGTAVHPDMESLSAALDELYGGAIEPAVRRKGETQCVGFAASFLDDAYALGKEKGVAVLDAPVSGGDKGAREATLSIMAGGDEDAFEKALPFFNAMGKSVLLMGPAGFGQHTKAANQIAVAGATAAYTEAIIYAQKVGLDPEKMLNAISGGAAGSWQINNMAPRALHGDHAPGFFIKHFVKDMRIVKDEAAAKGVDLEMLDSVLALYEKMMDLGYENDGTQALIKYYQK